MLKGEGVGGGEVYSLGDSTGESVGDDEGGGM